MYTGPNAASLKLANTCLKLLERARKLEFLSLAWKAKAQPLYHTRENTPICAFIVMYVKTYNLYLGMAYVLWGDN